MTPEINHLYRKAGSHSLYQYLGTQSVSGQDHYAFIQLGASNVLLHYPVGADSLEALTADMEDLGLAIAVQPITIDFQAGVYVAAFQGAEAAATGDSLDAALGRLVRGAFPDWLQLTPAAARLESGS